MILNYKIYGDPEVIADGIGFWYVPKEYAFRTGEVYGGTNDFMGLLVAIGKFQNGFE